MPGVLVEQGEPARCLTSWNPDGLAEFARRLTEAECSKRACVLDLTDEAIAGESSAAAVRLYVPSVMVLANLLIGRFRDAPLIVRLPSSSGLKLQLARGGLFFALANRREVTWADDAPEAWDRVAMAWMHPFHPSDAEMCREALVNIHDLERDAWVVHAAFQRYLLSVIHPHTRPARTLRSDLHRIARRWLSTRLDVRQGSELVSTLVDCAEVFYEIVVNVPDHAGLGYEPVGASLGQMYATLGGGRDSHNRLHFSVLDNGVGLPRRVNERHTDCVRSAEGALTDAILGKLPRREGGRGVGLSRVREIADQYAEELRSVGGSSSIRIVTNGDDSGSASELDWRSASEPATSTIAGLPVQGTLVWVSLGLEQRTISDDAHQLELTFAEPVAG